MIEFETDSRKIKPGQTFVAIQGNTVDGHDFIEKAIENGATKIIVEKDVKCSVETLKVNSTKEYLRNELVSRYSEDINKMNIIGVTGTNGKTTTCYLTYQMLNKLGHKAAYIGTIGFYYEGHKEELPNTTPEILTIYKLMLEARQNNCEYVVMEVSSHSLEELRIAGIKLAAGGFTNLTQDHLDFHKSMDNYLNAKLKIINYLKDGASLIVNNDDPYAESFINSYNNVITLGYKSNSNILIKNVDYSASSTKIEFTDDGADKIVTTNLISKFNVYNYLTCYAILKSIGIDSEEIINITKDVKAPKGRCEIIKLNNFTAVIDYAHTPDAVEKVITSFLELKHNRIITIVGCGGDRDPVKRPIMGTIACKLSNYVIFTNDNPRTEDPKKIMDDITKPLEYSNFEVIFDRKEAIYKALNISEKDDIILILGKGHEDYQIIGTEKIHSDDFEFVNDWKKENE